MKWCGFFLALLLLAVSPLAAEEATRDWKGSPPESAVDLTLSDSERAFLRSHPVLRVGNEDDWPPFDFSEHGIPRGYAIDHLELLGKKLGISFEYVNGHTWAELLELFRSGELDILPSLWISEGRKRYMLFTEPYLELPYVIVTSRSRPIRNFEELAGKTVAVPRGYIQEEVLERDFPEIGLLRVDNPLQGLKAVSYGTADAYIGYRGVVDYLIATRFFTDLRVSGESRAPGLGPQGLYIGVRKELEPLRNLLQRAMDSVTGKERLSLSQRWISPQRRPYPDLTGEEAAYLRNHRVLRVNNLQNWAPFNFYQGGAPRGFCVDYVRMLGDKLGIEIEFVSGPAWNEFMARLESGDIDLLIDVVETEKRRRKISFTEPYLTIFSGIVSRQDSEGLDSLEGLAGRTVAVPDQFYFQEILEEYYPEIHIITKDTLLDCLMAVSSGEAEAALAEKPVSDYLITKHFLTDLKSTPILDSIHFKNTPVAIGVRKDRPILRNIMQKSMEAVTEQELAVLYGRWFKAEDAAEQSARVALSPEEREIMAGREAIRMCVHPDRMPFEGVDEQGRHVGLVAEVLSAVSDNIGVPLQVVQATSWRDSIESFRRGECELLASASKADDNLGRLSFSEPYFEAVSVMVTREDEPYLSDLESLDGGTVAIAVGNQIGAYIEANFPEISVFHAADLEAALEAVAEGKADAAVDSLMAVNYQINRRQLYDLKIAGQTPYKSYLRIGIAPGAAELKPILDKALAVVAERDLDRIGREWLSIRFEKQLDTALLWKILFGGALVITVVMLWNRKLSRLNRELGEAHQELEKKSRELEMLSVTDGLTGLYNRMKLDTILENECQRHDRSGQDLSVIMLDVDHFKQVNDTSGHHVGDRVLRELADILSSQVRSTDEVGRWGGEEFLIVCPDTVLDGAVVLAEKLRRSIEAYGFAGVGACTCSFGVSQYHQLEQPESMVIRADQALYRAKNGGRNRVETCRA